MIQSQYKTINSLIVALGFLFAGLAQAATYELDPSHSSVGFTVVHLGITDVDGTFGKYKGTFDFDAKTNTIKAVDIKIETDSIDTKNAKREEHLKSNDFFDVKKFPNMTFKSDRVEMAADGKTGKAFGRLTIKDKTKEVVLDLVNRGEVEFMGTKKVGFSATTSIERDKFGLVWSKVMETGGLVVSNTVKINIKGEANQVSAAAPEKKGDKKKK